MARAALDLFARQGYDDTTVDEIAAAVGISRRTFFRYYESKPDVVWGEFDAELGRLRDRLAEAPADEPMMDVLRRSVIATNRFGAGELDELRIRMVLSAPSPRWWPTRPSATRSGATWWPASPPAGSGVARPTSAPRPWPGRPSGRPWPPSPAGPGARGATWSPTVDRAFRLLATGFDGHGDGDAA